MSCFFNPLGCAQSAALDLLWSIPWWGWALAIVIALLIAWRLAGIAGVTVAALGIGYLFGRNPVIDPIKHIHSDDPDAK